MVWVPAGGGGFGAEALQPPQLVPDGLHSTQPWSTRCLHHTALNIAMSVAQLLGC
jgi:hypothetical protein